MDLIRCNATEASHCKWITATYSEVMIDHKHVYEDGKMFLRRLKRHLEKLRELSDAQKSFQHIMVAEPQGEGHGNSWHLHVLLIFDDTAPYLENDVIADIWDNGITKTHRGYDAEGKDKTKEKGKEKTGHKIGENGTKTTSETIAQKGSTERIDVENPNPGQRDGQIHYHDAKNQKYIYDIVNQKFLDSKGINDAASSIQKLLKLDWIQKAIKKALKYLGE